MAKIKSLDKALDLKEHFQGFIDNTLKGENLIIAFVGSKKAGKTSGAGFLNGIFKSSNLMSFSDPLKEITSVVFKIPRGDLDDESKTFFKPIEFWGKSLRKITKAMTEMLMVANKDSKFDWRRVPSNFYPDRMFSTPSSLYEYIGRDLIPTLDPDFCSDMLLSKIKANKFYIIDDLWDPKDYDTLAKRFRKLYIIKIKRKTDNKKLYPREKDWDTIPAIFEINNKGSIAEFKQELDAVLLKISGAYQQNKVKPEIIEQEDLEVREPEVKSEEYSLEDLK